MTPNLKLQEAIDFIKALDKYDYDTERFRDYLKTLISAAQSIMAGTTEITKLREFVDYILQEGSWQGCDIDGGDAQDKAEQLGLIELRPIKEEDSIDGEKEHYFTKWTGNPKPSGEVFMGEELDFRLRNILREYAIKSIQMIEDPKYDNHKEWRKREAQDTNWALNELKSLTHLPKQMTVDDIRDIIHKSPAMERLLPSEVLFIATALFEAVYGGGKE